MRIEIDNILGVEHARIDLNPGGAVEVIGPNASGKTSIAIAAQALLAQEMNPLGAPAPQVKRVYVHEGAQDGEANLTDGQDQVTWKPGSGSITAPPGTFYSRPEALGLVDYTARTGAKERAAQLQSALLPAPELVMDAIRKALAAYLDPEDLNGVLKVIGERGWEAAASVYADRARLAKRQWSDKAGRNWGLKVAADWRPDGWLADYDHMTVSLAEDRVGSARDALTALHRVQAVSEADLERADNAKRRVVSLENEEARLHAEAAPLEAELVAIQSNRQSAIRVLREAERDLQSIRMPLACPHCSGLVFVHGDAILKSEGNQDEVKAQAQKRKDDATEEYDKALKGEGILADRLGPTSRAINKVVGDLGFERRAAAVTGTAATPEHSTALSEAEEEVERAKEVVRVVQVEREAHDLHETIVRYVEAARAIGPEGVRAKMLEKGLSSLNAGLGAISSVAKWPVMAADEKGGLTWSGRPIVLCSESEKWRAQASMQLTLAAITGSRVVVLDRADLLDWQGRVGLYDAIQRVTKATGIAVLLCSTENGGVLADWPIVRIAKGRTA